MHPEYNLASTLSADVLAAGFRRALGVSILTGAFLVAEAAIHADELAERLTSWWPLGGGQAR